MSQVTIATGSLGLHYTKKFLIRLDCTVMKSSSDVFFDAGNLNGIWSSEGSI